MINLYMFCIQTLYKSKFCIITNVQKLYIDQIPKYIQKKVQTVQTLYKV